MRRLKRSLKKFTIYWIHKKETWRYIGNTLLEKRNYKFVDATSA
jgi:hypothetical protein